MDQEKYQNQNEANKQDISQEISDEEINRRIVEFAKRIGGIGIEKKKHSIQYQYTNVDMESVVNNIEEYVIPECQQACKLLWLKNIETFMTSNYEDQGLYVLFSELSSENQRIFDEMSKNDVRYFFDENRHCYGIRVKGINEESSSALNELTKVFSIQDVENCRYQAVDDYLEKYKRKDGASYVDEYGNICRDINPALKDVSLIDALQASESENLYIEEENRVYSSPLYLEWHKRYKNSLNQK